MCTVQVLLFADVTRRPDVSFDTDRSALSPGQGSLPRSICRRLFADDNCPRPAALLKKLEADLEKSVKERWNFDFRTGKPLPGRYQWVSVRPCERVPTEDSVISEVVPQKTSGSNTSTQKRPCKSQSMTQSKITDFLQQRKRHRTADSDISPKLKSRRLTDFSSTSH